VLLSFFVSWVVVRTQMRGRMFLDGLTFLAHSVPGIVIALAFIFVYLQEPFRSLQLYGTIWIVSLALITQYIAFTTRTTNAAITQVHKELEEAARISGVGRITTLLRITQPLVLPPCARFPCRSCWPAKITGRCQSYYGKFGTNRMPYPWRPRSVSSLYLASRR
jgi:iron(III) transport system permease protein